MNRYAIKMVGRPYECAVRLKEFKLNNPECTVFTTRATTYWFIVSNIPSLPDARRIAHVYFNLGGRHCYAIKENKVLPSS